MDNNPITLVTGGNNANTTYSGVISGQGTLVHNGSGTLVLTGSNTYTGGTILGPDAFVVGNPAACRHRIDHVRRQRHHVLYAKHVLFERLCHRHQHDGNDRYGKSTRVTLSGPISGSGSLNKTDCREP